MDSNQKHEGATQPSWTRRDLLVRGGQSVAAIAAVGGLAWYLHDPVGDAGLERATPVELSDYFAPVGYSPAAPRLSVVYGDAASIERMVRAAIGGLDAGGMGRFIGGDDTVLIKPNVGFDRHPALGACSSPEVVAAVATLCREAGAKRIIVADNPIEDPAACFAKSGIREAAEKSGASVLLHANAHDAPVVIRPGRPDPSKNEALSSWPIFWKALKGVTKVIGVPVIKDHNLCSASMTMKNWYGLLGGRRNQFHQAIHDIISDLGLMMKPTLIVADGTRVMMRNGPTGGRLDDVRPGGEIGRPVVVAGVDQVACDSWCYQKLLGRDPAQLTYLELAYQKFGQDPARLTARGWQEYQSQGKLVELTI